MNKENIVFLLCLGSNEDGAYYMERSKKLLGKSLGRLLFSKELQTEPIGVESPLFLNCLVCGYTRYTESELIKETKRIECVLYSTKEERERGVVRIDVDLLQYGDKKTHLDDWKRSYVQDLLADLLSKAPELSRHFKVCDGCADVIAGEDSP